VGQFFNASRTAGAFYYFDFIYSLLLEKKLVAVLVLPTDF
jgi:hypothetical protein